MTRTVFGACARIRLQTSTCAMVQCSTRRALHTGHICAAIPHTCAGTMCHRKCSTVAAGPQRPKRCRAVPCRCSGGMRGKRLRLVAAYNLHVEFVKHVQIRQHK
jgi:hypothetical protein